MLHSSSSIVFRNISQINFQKHRKILRPPNSSDKNAMTSKNYCKHGRNFFGEKLLELGKNAADEFSIELINDCETI